VKDIKRQKREQCVILFPPSLFLKICFVRFLPPRPPRSRVALPQDGDLEDFLGTIIWRGAVVVVGIHVIGNVSDGSHRNI
jgi:hypothetical protein